MSEGGSSSVSNQHWVYFSCNPLKWQGFNPNSKHWVDLPEIQADTRFQELDKESMGVGSELLVLANDELGQIIFKCNLLTDSWSNGKPMNTPRRLFGSASLGNIAIFAGGVNAKGEVVDTVECYDSNKGKWETLPNSLLKPRKMSSGVFMDGKFYVIGGSGGDHVEFSCGEEYDFVAKKWRAIPGMSPGGGGGSMAPPLLAVVDNELYAAVVGGGGGASMVVKKFDKKKVVWDEIGELPKRAKSEDGWGIAFRGCGNHVMVIGGPRTQGKTNHVEIYSWVPSKGTTPRWIQLDEKKCNNFVYNCAIIGRRT